jgi:hypothetical protein
MRRLTELVMIASSVLAAGCLNVEQTLTLERNLSGNAAFTMNVDMEPAVGFMVGMQRAMEGKTGAPTPAELEQARKEFLASGMTTTSGDFEKGKKEFESTLPQGVKLLDAAFKEDGLKFGANFLFGFDNVSKLSQIKFPKGAAQGGPGGGSPVESPFDMLQVVDDGKTVLVSSPAQNPLSQRQAQLGQMPMDGPMKKQAEDLLKGMRVAFKITAPFEVIEHNAHRREGNTLVWDYDVQTLEKLTADQSKQGIRVRYRK